MFLLLATLAVATTEFHDTDQGEKQWPGDHIQAFAEHSEVCEENRQTNE